MSCTISQFRIRHSRDRGRCAVIALVALLLSATVPASAADPLHVRIDQLIESAQTGKHHKILVNRLFVKHFDYFSVKEP